VKRVSTDIDAPASPHAARGRHSPTGELDAAPISVRENLRTVRHRPGVRASWSHRPRPMDAQYPCAATISALTARGAVATDAHGRHHARAAEPDPSSRYYLSTRFEASFPVAGTLGTATFWPSGETPQRC